MCYCITFLIDMFMKDHELINNDLRILRIYSKSIENKYYYGPHSCKVATYSIGVSFAE